MCVGCNQVWYQVWYSSSTFFLHSPIPHPHINHHPDNETTKQQNNEQQNNEMSTYSGGDHLSHECFIVRQESADTIQCDIHPVGLGKSVCVSVCECECV